LVQIKVKKIGGASGIDNIPKKATAGSAGVDLVAVDFKYGNKEFQKEFILKPGCSVLVRTGICVEIPEGYEMQIRPRSGLALKYGITVLNSPGTIDSDYRNEVGVILINHGKRPFKIRAGDRIAQAVVKPVPEVEYVEVDELSETERKGGFGSTGK